MVIPNRSNKGCPLLITQSQRYLVVALKSVQKTHPSMTYSGIHKLVYPRHGERIFWADLVQICEVHTYLPLSIFLLRNHSVGNHSR